MLVLQSIVFPQTPIERTYLHGEHSADFEQSNQWIRMKDYKYVWHTQSGIEQFFDIKNDPRELKNLMNVPEYADAVKECRDILIDVLKDREEGYSDGRQLHNAMADMGNRSGHFFAYMDNERDLRASLISACLSE